jgi:hypothetical protein
MTMLMNLAIVLAIFAVVVGVQWAVRVAFGGTTQNHVWLFVLLAVGMVIWAVLDATGIVHESPYRTAQTYIYGVGAAVILVIFGLGARWKRR